MKCLRKRMVRYEGDDKCAICLSNLKSARKSKFVVRLHCSHLFHPKCIDQWVGTCPVCRQAFYLEHFHYINDINGNKILYINYFLPSIYNLVMWELRRYLCELKYLSKKWALKEAKKYVTVRDFSTFFMEYGTIPKKYVQEYRIWRF